MRSWTGVWDPYLTKRLYRFHGRYMKHGMLAPERQQVSVALPPFDGLQLCFAETSPGAVL